MLDRLLENRSGDFDFEHGDNMCDYNGEGCGYCSDDDGFDPWNWFLNIFGLGESEDDKGGDWDDEDKGDDEDEEDKGSDWDEEDK